jgi:hypothetical protein
MPISYSTPPLNPELNASSPFYATMNWLAVVTQAQGLPRDLVKNWEPLRTAGYGGGANGEDARIVPNAFPFNAPADSAHAGDYTIRRTNGTRALNYPYGAALPSGANPMGTIFLVFKFEDVDGPNLTAGSYAPILAFTSSVYYDQGLELDLGGYPSSIGVLNTGTNAVLAVGGSAASGQIYNSACVLTPGHWYAAAILRSDYNAMGVSKTLLNAMRIYLHDLTANTRLTTTGSGVSQSFTGAFGGTTDSIYASNFNLMPFALLPCDVCLFPGRTTLAGWGYADFIGQVHMAGFDRGLWDDSGFFAAIPAGFSSVDQFTYFVSNIYEMVGSTYATGGSAPTLTNSSSTTQTDSYSNAVGYPYLTTSATAPTGTATGTPLVALGHCVASRVNNTVIELSWSRPQGGPIAPGGGWTHRVYQSEDGTVAAGSGTLVATLTGYQSFYQYAPSDTKLQFLYVVSTDGTNTYTYNQVQAAIQPYAPQRSVLAGHSIGTPTGSVPDLHMTRAAQALGFDMPLLNICIDGASGATFNSASGTTYSLPWISTENAYTRLTGRIATELSYLPGGTTWDVVFLLLVGNTAIDTTDWSAIATALLGTGVKRVVFLVPSYQWSGHDLIGNAANMNAIAPLVAMANGTTILTLGGRAPYFTTNFSFMTAAGHPDTYLSELEGFAWARDYYAAVLAPSGGGRQPKLIKMGC